jgi:hypothetical protein
MCKFSIPISAVYSLLNLKNNVQDVFERNAMVVVVSSFFYGLTFMSPASHYCVGACGLSNWPSDVCCPYQ